MEQVNPYTKPKGQLSKRKARIKIKADAKKAAKKEARKSREVSYTSLLNSQEKLLARLIESEHLLPDDLQYERRQLIKHYMLCEGSPDLEFFVKGRQLVKLAEETKNQSKEAS